MKLKFVFELEKLFHKLFQETRNTFSADLHRKKKLTKSHVNTDFSQQVEKRKKRSQNTFF